jgi:hypothetical protein
MFKRSMYESRFTEMNMRYLAALFGALVVASCGAPPVTLNESPTLTLGMKHELALGIIRECGGQDITSKLAVVGPRGEWPLSGLFWDFEQYNSVLEISVEDGNLVGIDYWTVADFSESKSHRAESRKSLKSLTFEKQTKTVKIQVL